MPELSTGTMVERAKCEQLERVVIGNNEKFIQVKVQLPLREKEVLIDFLKKKISMCLHRMLTRPLGWIQTLFVTI